MDARFAAAAKLRLGFNRYTFVLVLRAVATFVVSFSVAYGFLEGSRETPYDPQLFAVGTSALFALACVGMALLFARNRLLHVAIRGLNERIEELSDRNWELREAEDRSRRFLAAQGDLIVRRDPQGRITYANDAYCALAGCDPAAACGSEAAPPVLQQGTVSVLGDGTRLHDQAIATACGPRWIAWRDVLVRDEGKEPELQSVGRDVTDRVEAERALAEARDAAQAASRAKSRFLATVSHEIRTPLNGILGMAELLLDTSLTPEQTTYAKAVKASGDALLALIDEILDYSKIEAGKIELQPRPFALAAWLEEAVELMAPRAHAKGLEIGSYADPRLPAEVVGDPVRLRQVLLNLLGNAIKFTAAGGIAVTAEPADAQSEVRLRVRDTGIGIASEAQERIFAEFEQADGDASRAFAGTGLGLAISRRIVEGMGGRITVASTPGRGSIFEVAVPLAAADLPARRQDREESTIPLGGSALIVSPGAVAADLVARHLRDWGVSVEIAASAAEAALRLAATRFDRLLVDGMIGIAAAGALADRAGGTTRRLVLVSPAMRHELPDFSRAGFETYLIKPVRAASLRLRLQGGAGAPAGGPAACEPAGEPPAGPGLAILVAEDNEINALLTEALLRKLGQRPTLVPGGREAVTAWENAAAQGAPFAAVLMDLQMPSLDGLAASRAIRRLERAQGRAPTPIFALTANAFADDHQACAAAEMDGVLIKPLARERLKELLESLQRRALAA